MSVKPENSVEPLIDRYNAGAGLDMVLPLRRVNLSGIPGGLLKSKNDLNGRQFNFVRPFIEGDDMRDIDMESIAEDPERIPMVELTYADITPTLWIASDMLKHNKQGIDGYYDKQGLAVSAMFALIRTTASTRNLEPMSLGIAIANDYTVDFSPRAKNGKANRVDIASRITRSLSQVGPLAELDDRPNLSDVMKHVANVATKRVVAIVSDFRGPQVNPDSPKDNWSQQLKCIAEGGNKIIAVEIVAPEDENIPEGIETIGHSPKGHIWSGKQGKLNRERYSLYSKKQQQMINKALSDVNAVHVRLRTDSPDWHSSLRNQLLNPSARLN